MVRSWSLSSLALVVALAASVASAQTRADPPLRVPADVREALSPAARAIAEAIPDEGTPDPESRHYFRSNEWRHDLYRPQIDGLGGAFVGVGSDQNYTMAAVARSQFLFVVDFDPLIPWVHEIYRVLVSASDTPDALIARFTEESGAESERLLAEGLATHPRARQIVRHFKRYRELWLTYLRRVQRLAQDGQPVSWLGRRELYEHVRALHRAGRIVARNGDVAGERTMRAVGDAARRLGLTVRAVYFSNAEQFFRYSPRFRENMRNLPTDERSIVLRTMRHRDLPRADDNWHYITQDFVDFRERIETGAYGLSFALVPDIVAGHAVGQTGISHMTSEIPRVVIEQARRRRAERTVSRAD